MEIELTYYLMRRADYKTFPHAYQSVEKKLYEHIAIPYDFEATITYETLLSFAINEIGYATFKRWNNDQQYGFKRAIELMWEKGLVSQNKLEQNQDFMDFIQEYFEYDAIEEYESEAFDNV